MNQRKVIPNQSNCKIILATLIPILNNPSLVDRMTIIGVQVMDSDVLGDLTTTALFVLVVVAMDAVVWKKLALSS